MDGMSGASAVIALGSFVATTIRELNKLKRNIRDAPKELLGLIWYLEQLESILNDASSLIHRLKSSAHRSDSLESIKKATEHCTDNLKTLELLINKFKGPHPSQNMLKKTGKSLKFVSKKDEIQQMQTKLLHSMTSLCLAISLDSSHKTYDIHDAVTRLTQLMMTNQKPSLLVDSSQSATQDKNSAFRSLDARRPTRSFSKEKIETWYEYNGVLGMVTVQNRSRFAGLEKRVVDAKSVSKELVVVLRPTFLKHYFELRRMKNFTRISSWTVNVDCVIDYKNPAFEMCRSGDILGLHSAFRGGRASPDMVNPLGMGLLHYAAYNYQLATCKWLLDNGVHANRVDNWRNKALTHMTIRPTYAKDGVNTNFVLDIARLLVRKQEDLSALDVSMYFQEYESPPEGAEFILSEYPVQYDMCSLDDDHGQIYPTLAAILKAYAREPSPWESILRALIRRGADLHAPVRRNPKDMIEIDYPCVMAEYGTPLDELFTWNEDRSAARTAADGWLRILASEGYNPSAYLEEEMNLRARDMHFTLASISPIGYDSPRRLFFEVGDRPSVSWGWWNDPASSTFLVREDFKCFITTRPDWIRITEPWQKSWPFTYPKWSHLHQGYARGKGNSDCKALLVAANARANRRVTEKAAKMARAQRLRRPRRVPGAWPN